MGKEFDKVVSTIKANHKKGLFPESFFIYISCPAGPGLFEEPLRSEPPASGE
jgi:hypothetical protein